ncbi:MAG: RagB/SusD family nutrient uptake outer membrane protein [Chitinophagaceae bacterium]|nr:RagB/SusD family nutrient uptake outer membrane protein [Chitinophagaceae bacterium]
MKAIKIFLAAFLFWLACSGCTKFLDKKSDQRLSTFRTVADLQSLLDDEFRLPMNFPSAPEVGADNLTMTNDAFNGMVDVERNRFIWAPDFVFNTETLNEWGLVYRVVNVANVVLDNVDNVTDDSGDEVARKTLRGHAYFFRGYCFMKAADVWCKAYHPDSSKSDLGLPLRLNANFLEPSVRSSLMETFQQIEHDLIQAADLLPVTNLNPIRPSKPAAFGALARLYLLMGNFEKAGKYADSCLALHNTLMDYNVHGGEIKPAEIYPFRRQNSEVIFDSGSDGSGTSLYRGKVDTAFYNSYSDDDWRKTLFYRKENDSTALFRGTYMGGPYFSGITTGEMYLVRAESYGRTGKIHTALNDVNFLLSNRYKTGTYTEFSSSDATIVINYILEHRRKELAFRMLRWSDIKRLNRLGYDIVQKRRLNGTWFVLNPNDPRYAMALPEIVIQRSGMLQNPR